MTDNGVRFDPRTRRLMPDFSDPKTERENPAKLERQQQGIALKELMMHPGYEVMKTIAYRLCICPASPASVPEAITWVFASARRTAMDTFFRYIEELARIAVPVDMPVVNGFRESIFRDDEFNHL
jgi:hypothetical protein